MPNCTTLKRKRREPCIGDLDTLITLQDRTITPPTTTVDFSETFTENAIVWAMINTVRGKTTFDSANVERDITHEFTVRFLTGVDSETWILHEDERYDILDAEDLEERHEWIVLRCAKLGPTSKAVNDA
jgi:SPP1 family predicted phage head-tail adaptor